MKLFRTQLLLFHITPSSWFCIIILFSQNVYKNFCRFVQPSSQLQSCASHSRFQCMPRTRTPKARVDIIICNLTSWVQRIFKSQWKEIDWHNNIEAKSAFCCPHPKRWSIFCSLPHHRVRQGWSIRANSRSDVQYCHNISQEVPRSPIRLEQ